MITEGGPDKQQFMDIDEEVNASLVTFLLGKESEVVCEEERSNYAHQTHSSMAVSKGTSVMFCTCTFSLFCFVLKCITKAS